MDWGLNNRLSRIIKPDKRTVMLAVDHGYFLGPLHKLEQPRKTITPLLEYADAVMLTRGILRTSIDNRADTPIVLRVSGGNSIANKDKEREEELANEGIATSIEDAIRLNASAVATSIYVGTKYEHQTLMNLAKLVNEATRYGIPVLAVTAVGKELGRKDAKYLALSCRIAAELGAHFVKTYHCEELEKVVEGCPVPIVIAGGKREEGDAELKALEMAYDSVKKGAAGVDMGRNIWQSDYPIAMIRAIKAIVHENAPAEEAYEIFKSSKDKSGKS